MIRLDTGTPGAGKSLINVDEIIKLEKSNKRNILLNIKIYQSNLNRINELNLQDELTYLTRKVGQGVDLKDEVFHFENEYFELFEKADRTEDYFQRSIFYNEIIERLNKEHNLSLNLIKPVRTIYTNIAGLEVDFVRPIPADADWRKLPDGSFVVYDEIQNIPIFSSETKTVDPIVKELTTHRHRGFDIVGITQFPNLVHPVFRALVGVHRHLVNSFGLKRSTKYEWSTVKLDPNAFRNKATVEIKDTFVFPKNIYKHYRSSTAHTHKRRLPIRFILIMAFVLLCCFSLFTCAFSDDKNIVKRIATGDSNSEQAKNSNADTSSTSTNNKNTDASTQKENEPDQDNSASQPVTDVQPVYSVSDPFDYEPTVTPQPVNHRVFAGCFCSKNTCKAYDNQGTLIDSINPKVCKELMQDSGKRPFDYFGTRQQNLQASVSKPEPTTTNYDVQQIENDVQPHLERGANGANSQSSFSF